MDGFLSPLMGDLAIRNEVVRGLEAAQPFKTAIVEHYRDGQTVCRSAEACGLEAAHAAKFDIDIGRHAIVAVTYKGINARVDGSTVLLKPHKGASGLIWSCTGGTLPALYRPKACRASSPATR